MIKVPSPSMIASAAVPRGLAVRLRGVYLVPRSVSASWPILRQEGLRGPFHVALLGVLRIQSKPGQMISRLSADTTKIKAGGGFVRSPVALRNTLFVGGIHPDGG